MPATPPISAPLVEVFSSIQGEGVLIGSRQVFVRLAHCNLACRYCDTNFIATDRYRIEQAPGSGVFLEKPNPADLAELTRLLEEWQQPPGLHHSLALTGGEPLLHAEILARWLPAVCRVLPVYLETNGTLPAELQKILPWVRWVSMDIKGEALTGQPTPWSAHAEFLQVAAGHLCQVKLVVDAGMSHEELTECAAFVQKHAPQALLVLQPRTEHGRPVLTGLRLLRFHEVVSAVHPACRVIPQVHPIMQID